MVVVVAFVVPGLRRHLQGDRRGDTGESADLPLPTQITVGISDVVTGSGTSCPVRRPRRLRLRPLEGDRDAAGWRGTASSCKIPAHIGDVVQKVALARWSRTFSGAVSSGVPILQAIKISGETAGNAVIQDAMDDVYASVRSGGSIARPLQENPIFPPMVSHMVAVGEESGQLETMLEKIADFYDAEVDAKVKALTSLIEPIMIIVVGVGRRLHRDLDVPADLQPLRQDPLAGVGSPDRCP